MQQKEAEIIHFLTRKFKNVNLFQVHRINVGQWNLKSDSIFRLSNLVQWIFKIILKLYEEKKLI